MIVAIFSRINVSTYSDEEFKALPPKEQILARLHHLEKVEEVVIDRVAVENADELRNRIMESCNTHGAVVAYMGDAFKERFLFDEGYDGSSTDVMAEAIFSQNIRAYPATPPSGKPNHIIQLGNNKAMRNPAGIAGPKSTIIFRVFAKDSIEFQKTRNYIFQLSNSSKLKLLNSTILGDIGDISNEIFELPKPDAKDNEELARRIKKIEAKHPQGMSDSEIEQTIISSLQEQENEIRNAIRGAFEEQYRKDPERFCENAKTFDIEAVIKQTRTQAGWIPSDRPQPLRTSDIVSRYHLRLVREEIDRICQNK